MERNQPLPDGQRRRRISAKDEAAALRQRGERCLEKIRRLPGPEAEKLLQRCSQRRGVADW